MKPKNADDFGKILEKIDPPKLEKLEFIRKFDPFFGIRSQDGRRLKAQILPFYYEGG